MNAKISVFAICVEAIVYLLLYNIHYCTFNFTRYSGGNSKLFLSYDYGFRELFELI